MAIANVKAVAIAIGFIFLNFAGQCYGYYGYGGLQYGFYNGKCRASDVETIVRNTVYSKFLKDRTIAPALIRMQFHDCFVNVNGPNSEKTAPPNLSVRGYDVIDAAKSAVERVCPGVVSCADIIVMATRDVVSFSGGGRYSVQTGRRDGLVSLAQNTRTLPPPTASVSSVIKTFAQKGLSATDMVYLLGGHTIGVAHCSLIKDRLYNFKNTGKPDPARDLAQIMLHRGVLKFDQDLALDSLTKSTVAAIARSSDFTTKFGQAMVKMGAIQVLTGKQGEIRKSCRAVNPLTLTSLIN
ncbi:peroxidase 60-like [Bidens hawaiensis]|uniref:peroxidase 60-like n=1 Tax=Bidens hawaiensis TaxID=980011 RepID=UPI00404AEBF4